MLKKKRKKARLCRILGSKCFIPNPPQLAPNFSWEGQYLIPDLHIAVPFRWFSRDGNTQMIAGDSSQPVYFTNFIYKGNFFTYTYKFPGLQPPFLPPLEPCQPIPFTLEQLNGFLAQRARFVGVEILKETGLSRRRSFRVNHFRVAVALPESPPGVYVRIPITCVDIYVDCTDSTVFRKVLQFGFQNLYDPELNEYFVISKTCSHIPEFNFPPACHITFASKWTQKLV
jgi:hypothetical protein